MHPKKLSTNSDYSQQTRILNVYNDLEIFNLNDRSKPKYVYTAVQSNNRYHRRTVLKNNVQIQWCKPMGRQELPRLWIKCTQWFISVDICSKAALIALEIGI